MTRSRAKKPARRPWVVTAAAAGLAGLAALAWLGYGRMAGPGANEFQATLSGFEEVPPLLTSGMGTFRARLAEDGRLEYELTYSGLSAPATAAHIHFGQPGVNGGIFAFLCGGDDKPACPGQGGTVTGRISPANILAIPDQGLLAGDFTGALRIIQAGVSYVNVHSTRFPAGEIRGQVR